MYTKPQNLLRQMQTSGFSILIVRPDILQVSPLTVISLPFFLPGFSLCLWNFSAVHFFDPMNLGSHWPVKNIIYFLHLFSFHSNTTANWWHTHTHTHFWNDKRLLLRSKNPNRILYIHLQYDDAWVVFRNCSRTTLQDREVGHIFSFRNVLFSESDNTFWAELFLSFASTRRLEAGDLRGLRLRWGNKWGWLRCAEDYHQRWCSS